MRLGIDYYLTGENKYDYVLLVNDDVDFFNKAIEKIVNDSIKNSNAVIVGATCNEQGVFTYGAMKLIEHRKNDLYEHVKAFSDGIECDTFNANCILLKSEIVKNVGNFDSMYRHSLADLDYGFMIKKSGHTILSSAEYVGICSTNNESGTWKTRL